jgi:hypothetical protein
MCEQGFSLVDLIKLICWQTVVLCNQYFHRILNVEQGVYARGTQTHTHTHTQFAHVTADHLTQIGRLGVGHPCKKLLSRQANRQG